MSNELDKTIRLVRKGKVTTDDRGQTVWDGTVQTAQLELVSTTMFEALALDEQQRVDLLKDAKACEDGLLAHDPERDAFEIISDDELKAALESSGKTMEPEHPLHPEQRYEVEEASGTIEELSLVSTQMLRVMLDPDTSVEPDLEEPSPPAGGGFDPYNSS